jgi:hypothetical protein
MFYAQSLYQNACNIIATRYTAPNPPRAAIEMRSNPATRPVAPHQSVVFQHKAPWAGKAGVKRQKACANINQRNQSW